MCECVLVKSTTKKKTRKTKFSRQLFNRNISQRARSLHLLYLPLLVSRLTITCWICFCGVVEGNGAFFSVPHPPHRGTIQHQEKWRRQLHHHQRCLPTLPKALMRLRHHQVSLFPRRLPSRACTLLIHRRHRLLPPLLLLLPPPPPPSPRGPSRARRSSSTKALAAWRRSR